MTPPECCLLSATLETGGDSNDDWIEIGDWTQRELPSFGPLRTVAGAEQVLNVTVAMNGDQVFWKKATAAQLANALNDNDGNACEGTTADSSENQTTHYSVGGSWQAISLHPNASAGDWIMCFKPNQGIWSTVLGRKLVLIAKPYINPPIVVVNALTEFTITGEANYNTDFILLSTAGCQDAADRAANSTILREFVDGKVDLTFSQAQSFYKVCFATLNSGGESQSDYVELDFTVEVVSAPSFGPRLAIEGSTQQLNVTGGRAGDQVAWTLRTEAGASCNGTGPASTQKTAAYYMASSQQAFFLHDTAVPGSWYLCYKPSGTLTGSNSSID